MPQSKLESGRRFLKPAIEALKPESFPSVLDAGCGDGAQLVILLDALGPDKKVKVEGIDISSEAIEICRDRVKERASLVVGDVGDLPFERDTFDVAFSFGVIGYTDSPRKSFEEIVRVTKSGGLIGLWLYPEKTGLSGFLFRSTRLISKKGGPLLTRCVADIIVPFLFFLPTASKVHLGNASWQQCREVVMVNIAPTQLAFFRKEELRSWFEEEEVEIVWDDLDTPITLWGRKK